RGQDGGDAAYADRAYAKGSAVEASVACVHETIPPWWRRGTRRDFPEALRKADAGGQASEIAGSATVRPGAAQQRRVSSGNETLTGRGVKPAATPKENQGVGRPPPSKVALCLQIACTEHRRRCCARTISGCAITRRTNT